ncbi:MAG: hypothetical protein ACU85E_05855 [Gammaproteobacteria bacterium]
MACPLRLSKELKSVCDVLGMHPAANDDVELGNCLDTFNLRFAIEGEHLEFPGAISTGAV